MCSPQARVISLSKVLEDALVTAGETATFQCELSFEGIAVEWFLGGTKLESSDRVSYFTSLNSTHNANQRPIESVIASTITTNYTLFL